MWWRQTKSYCKNIIRHFINKWSIDIKLFKAHADEKVNKKLKGQSKNEFKMFKKESRTIQDSRGKFEERFKIQEQSRSRFKTQDSRIKRRFNQDKN